MDYATSMAELATSETKFPDQAQLGRIRKEGATMPLPAQEADTPKSETA